MKKPLAALVVITTALAACKPAPVPPAVDAAAASPAVSTSDEVRLGDLLITAARTRETPTAGSTGVGFLAIRNVGTADDRLLGATAAEAASVELHEMSMNDGVMQMRALNEGLAIPAGSTVELRPGGVHLMMIGLERALVAGQAVPVVLRFEKAGEITVQFPVAALAP